MFAGFTSVETEGVAPGKSHCSELTFEEMLTKFRQVPLQMIVSLEKKLATGCEQFNTLIKLPIVFSEEQKLFDTVSVTG
jgi:hypothetical protein